MNGPNRFYKLMKTIPSLFNCTKFITKKKLHTLDRFQDQHQRSSCLHPPVMGLINMSVSLSSQLNRFPSSHVTIYLSKSVLTIFSKVSSHLRRGLVTPHWRDLLYSFNPKYSLSSLAASPCSIQRQQKHKENWNQFSFFPSFKK